VLDTAGNVVVTGHSQEGTTTDWYTAKYAAVDGRILWERRFDTSVAPASPTPISGINANGDVFVAGQGANAPFPEYLVKYSAETGGVLWEIGHAEHGFRRIVVDANKDVLLLGSGIAVSKYSGLDGGFLWQQRLENPIFPGTRSADLDVDLENNAFVTGSSAFGFGTWIYYTAKYSANEGFILWEKSYSGLPGQDPFTGHSPVALLVDENGDAIVTGESSGRELGLFESDIQTIKYRGLDGARLWERRYNSDSNQEDMPIAIALGPHGDLALIGVSSYNAIPCAYCGPSEIYTARYTATDGSLIWEKRFNSHLPYRNRGKTVAFDPGGNVLMTGHSVTAKYAAESGTSLWVSAERTIPGGPAQITPALAVNAVGDLIVAGGIENNIHAMDYYAVKRRSLDGQELWRHQYDVPAGGNDYLRALAVDHPGNAIVTGVSSNLSNADFCTVKYAASTGKLLWERRYNGPADLGDFAEGVAVAGNGDALVTGYSFNADSVAEWYTARYAAVDGALLWERRYAGPAARDLAPATGPDYRGSFARGIAVDPAGNAVVTGESGNGQNFDFCTAKYNATSGEPLWEQRHAGAAQGDDKPIGVVIDADGNAIVTGQSWNGRNVDFLTIKYAAADGAVLWERRYNGPADLTDRVVGIGIDDHGNIAVTGITDEGGSIPITTRPSTVAGTGGSSGSCVTTVPATVWTSRSPSPSIRKATWQSAVPRNRVSMAQWNTPPSSIGHPWVRSWTSNESRAACASAWRGFPRGPARSCVRRTCPVGIPSLR
jgi:hypothetical protein